MRHSKIVFVCAANICRSPMAEAICKEYIRQNNGTGEHSVIVRSAGIGNTHGSDASDQAIHVMRERKVDLSRHKAHTVDGELVEWADLILCMSEDQVSSLRQSFPEAQNKFHLLTTYCGSSGDIADPSGKPTSAFEECARQLDGLIASLWEKVK